MAKKSLFDRFRERTKKRIQPTPVEENLKPRGTRYLSGFKDAPVETNAIEPINKPVKAFRSAQSKPVMRDFELDNVPKNILKQELFGKIMAPNPDQIIEQNVKAPNPNLKIFRDRLQSMREKRKTAAQNRYEEQIKARDKRGGILKPDPEGRQKRYDQQFGGKPFGQGTVLSQYSGESQMRSRIQDRIEKNIARRAKEEKERNKK